MDRPFLKIILIAVLITLAFRLPANQPEQPELIRAWKLRDIFTEQERVEIDTMLNRFHINNPVFKRGISHSFLGNTGHAAMNNYFAQREEPSDFFFIDPFRHYLTGSAEVSYYNTRRPFTLIDFSTGGPRSKNEKILGLLHTQNINPDFNAGFRYFNINSEGQYRNQRAITNALTFFTSYVVDSYQVHANINLNSARVIENGGLFDEQTLLNPDYETEDHPVRLQEVRNESSNTSLLISQSWQPFYFSQEEAAAGAFMRWFQGFRVYHILRYDRFRRTYHDSNPTSGFYADVLLNSSRTFDSVYYRNMTNMLMVQLPEFSRGNVSFAAKGGLKNEMLIASYNRYPDTLFHYSAAGFPYIFMTEPDGYTIDDRDDFSLSSNALIATARGSIGGIFGIWGEGNLYFEGYRAGEYDIRAGINFNFFEGRNRSVIQAGIRQSEITPSVFLNSFVSNHFEWHNNFGRQGRSTLSGSIAMPERNFSVDADFSLLTNYIWFDNTARPVQHNDVIAVLGVSLRKGFNLWKFHFNNIVNYQLPGREDILPLPILSLYHATWFEQSLLQGVMNVQLGFDVHYSTSHQGYAYQPALSQFHTHSGRMLGNYPYVDVFLNIKHKRARIFVKGEHINSGLMDHDYFSVLDHPRNQQVFKFGFSWSFYN